MKNKITRILAIIVIAGGILVTIGWVFNIDVLKSVSLAWVTMKFSTAISFICSGVTLYFISRVSEGKSGIAQIAMPTTGLIIFLFVTTVLISYLTGFQQGIEELFIKERDPILTTSPGRPSVPTMVNFILIILAGIFSSSDSAKLKKLVFWIGFILGGVGGLSIIGYVVNAPLLYYYVEEWSTAMALHTGILFVMMGVGLILVKTQKPALQQYTTIKIKTKLISLFLVVSVISGIFVGLMSYNFGVMTTSIDVTRDSILLFGTVIAIAVGFFAFHTSKTISDPLIQLKDAAKEAAKGKFVTVTINTDDEIGLLARTFNSMTETIQARSKELELKNKISEKVNAHLHELINKENEMNAHLKSISEQLKNQAEKLREVDVAKEEFSSMITHELKTPLFPILGYCEMLQSRDFGELTDEQKEKIQIIYDSAQSLLQLVQDVLDVHKLELGKMQPHISDYDAKEMIDTVLNRFFPVAFERKINLFNITEAGIRCRCDNERIIQVLNNLVNNALKFVPDNTGQIEVSAKYNDGSVMFAIKDNGSGIPNEKQENLFQKFYQVDSSISRNRGGTGLGLAICKGIMELHKGRIWVESETGIGTTLFFSIPAG